MSELSSRLQTLYTKYSDLMDRNIKGVQIGCYSVAFIGLTVALRKVRPFSRFKKPSDVPKSFIKERRPLDGVVERIEPSGALLLINHQPLIPLPGIKAGQLPAKVLGIEVTGHGISWLQTLVAGNKVTFIPTSKTKDYVECQIKMEQITHDKKIQVIDIGEALVSVGFATIVERPIGKKDPDYSYFVKLKYAEDNALRKKMGLKYYIKPTKVIVTMVGSQLSNFTQKTFKFIMKKIAQKPKDVPKIAAA